MGDTQTLSRFGRREVQELKEELAMMQLINELTNNKNNNTNNLETDIQQQQQQPYSAAARERLREAVLTWLQQPDGVGDVAASSLAGLPLTSVRQLREVLFAVKVGCWCRVQGLD